LARFAEPAADVEIPNIILRLTKCRVRPADVPVSGNFSGTCFDSVANPLKAKGGCASGHAASAFAVQLWWHAIIPTKMGSRRCIWACRLCRIYERVY
jgi:hypothetical protein